MKELISFETKDELILDGILHSNNNDSIVIYIHGYADNFYSFPFNTDLPDTLLKNNIDFLVFNNRGHDFITRIKTKNKKLENSKKRLGAVYEKISDSYLDIDASLEYVMSKGYKEVYLVGHSLGCTKIVSSFDKLNYIDIIKKIILIAPVDTSIYKTNKNKALIYEEKEFIESSALRLDNIYPKTVNTRKIMSLARYLEYIDDSDILRVFPYNEDRKFDKLAKISIPILAIIGEEDSSFGTTDANKIAKMLEVQNNKLKSIIYERDGHTISLKIIKMLADIIKFIK